MITKKVFYAIITFMLVATFGLILCIRAYDRMLFTKFYVEMVSMDKIKQAIIDFKNSKGYFPNKLNDIYPNNPDECDSIPFNVWGNKYIYEKTDKDFKLISLGRDNEKGGFFYNIDIIFTMNNTIFNTI
jgi:hypothetical protein